MGFVQKRYSDVSHTELADDDALTVHIKSASKVFDCSHDELKKLKTVNNVEELVVTYPGGQVSTLLVTKTELNKLVTDEQIAGFDSARGRRSGYSPTARNGSSLIKSIQGES